MAAKLVAEEGIQKGLVLSLDEGNEWVIGRDPDACQLLIEDPSASRKHLLCRKTADGIFLQNLSSTNPVLINDEEVIEPRLLRNGDLVKIGSGSYRFYSEEEAQLLDKGEISQLTIHEKEPNGNEDQILPKEAIVEVSQHEPNEKESHEEQSEAHPEEEPIPPEAAEAAQGQEIPSAIAETFEKPIEELPSEANEESEREKEEMPAEEEMLEKPLEETPSEAGEEAAKEPKEPPVQEETLEKSLEETPSETAVEEVSQEQEKTPKEVETLEKPEEETYEEGEASEYSENYKERPVEPETMEKTSEEQNVEAEVKETAEKREEMPQEEVKVEEAAISMPEGESALEQPKNEQESKSMINETETPVMTEEHIETEELTEKVEEHEIEPEELESEHISIFEEPAEKSIFPEINFDLTETGRWLLKVVGGPNHGAEFTMQPASTYVIGTDPNSCDIVFHDTSVSRQHAKITVNEDDTIVLEDLKSRNGTFVDGKPLTGKETVPTNTLISMGTSSFVVYDREGEMQTIISPLLPSIVKVLKEEPKQEQPVPAESASIAEPPASKPAETAPPMVEVPKKKEHAHEALGAFILIAIITGLFVIIGIGTTTLFKSQPVVTQQLIHPDRDLTQALSAFPNVKYSFNRGTGRLLLVGHVLTASDKNQLLYNLQGFKYIRSIDDSGVIIDEGVWREINQVLSQNPNWKGISIHSPTPGHFVISGYLKTRKQAEQLWDYMSSNFPYLDLLEKRVIVEEDVVTSIGNELQSHGFKDVSAQMNEGEVILSGNVQAGKMPDFDKAITSIKDIPGVRSIKNFVTELAPEQSLVNISDKYEVTGISKQGATTSVVINGRILTRGDVLDGMTITSIKPNAVFLEKEGIKYRIDFSK